VTQSRITSSTVHLRKPSVSEPTIEVIPNFWVDKRHSLKLISRQKRLTALTDLVVIQYEGVIGAFTSKPTEDAPNKEVLLMRAQII
jgi:hypothetical protein